MTIYKQGLQGNTIIDWRETGREMIRSFRHDPDKPLEIDWNHTQDVRDNRDPEEVWMKTEAGRVGM